MVVFFFSSRRRHTRWNCDWSSDVCSSDLAGRTVSDDPFVAASRCRAYARRITNHAGEWNRETSKVTSIPVIPAEGSGETRYGLTSARPITLVFAPSDAGGPARATRGDVHRYVPVWSMRISTLRANTYSGPTPGPGPNEGTRSTSENRGRIEPRPGCWSRTTPAGARSLDCGAAARAASPTDSRTRVAASTVSPDSSGTRTWSVPKVGGASTREGRPARYPSAPPRRNTSIRARAFVQIGRASCRER